VVPLQPGYPRVSGDRLSLRSDFALHLLCDVKQVLTLPKLHYPYQKMG
jgi:hypothetical protein